MPELPKGFEHAQVDPKWYAFWERIEAFRGDPSSGRPRFSMVLPPPNVTGSLHIGHALNHTLPDIIVRWKRMQGMDVLWLPGTDHAGIATQNVVEKQLALEGKTRHDLGREAFEARVWEWVRESRQTITGQMRKLGESVDWSRERFTLDEQLSRAVRREFVTLYRDGLIYRDKYIVNWCTRCRTALSDLETIHRDTAGKLYYLRYPRVDGHGHVVIATTRPETMLGDTAVAVNPDDERYRHLAGTRLRLPVVGRELPVIADAFVDPAFGTGVVKVTPAHDPNDFAMGKRHSLPAVAVIDEDGRMTAAAGPVRRARPLQGARRAGGRSRAGRLHREDRGASARRRPLRALQHRGGAAGVAAVVGEDRAAGLRGDPCGGGGAHPVRARELDEDVLRVDDEHPRLVHLAAAVVGTPDSRLVLRRLRRDDRGGGDAGRVRVRRGAAAGDRCSRHLVQLGAVAVQHARLAGRHGGPAALLSDRSAHHRIRHHLLLGRPDDHAGAALHRRRAVPRRLHHGAGARRARPEDEQVEGQRRRSAEDHGRDRRRRAAVHAGGDGVAGHGHRAVGGPAHRLPPVPEQDLECVPLPADEPRRGAGAVRRAPVRPARPDPPLGAAPGQCGVGRGRGGADGLSLRRGRRSPVPFLLARVRRLVHRDDQAAPAGRGARAGAGRGRAARGARSGAAAAAPVHPVHHRGDSGRRYRGGPRTASRRTA